jgi:hypothetical protein
MSDAKRRTRAKRDEHHLMLLARLLEEHPGVLEQATMTLAENASPQQQSAPSTHSVPFGDQEFSFNHDFVDCHMFGAPSVPHSDIQHSEGRGGEACSTSSKMAEERWVISHDLALHLVEVFFDKVAPWLPLLHQPRFLQHCAHVLTPGRDALANATPEDVFTLLGIFALAARYSTLDYHWAVPLQEREQIYLQEAREVYKKQGPPQEPSLRYLQGCLILASYLYTSGLSLQGRILVGVCINLAIELDLPHLDAEHTTSEFSLDVTDQEERRRAWWVTWELDTFGSIMLKRPFGIDRRHFSVRLPISNQAWYAGTPVDSVVILHKEVDWVSLRSSPNQSPRAWFLIANHLLSRIYDRLFLAPMPSDTEFACYQNEIACLQLSLPPSFHLRSTYLESQNGTTANNWIIGTHLLLVAASYMIRALKSSRQHTDSDADVDHSSPQHIRALETSTVLRMWPPNCLSTAHPFWAAALCPIFSTPFTNAVSSATSQSFGSLTNLVLQRFADNWELGRIMLCMFYLETMFGLFMLIRL